MESFAIFIFFLPHNTKIMLNSEAYVNLESYIDNLQVSIIIQYLDFTSLFLMRFHTGTRALMIKCFYLENFIDYISVVAAANITRHKQK